MSIATEISRLQTVKACLERVLKRKGYAIPSDATIDEYPAIIDTYDPGLPISWLENTSGYLAFKFITDGSVFWNNAKGDIQYSKNGEDWAYFNGSTISCEPGDEILFKGNMVSGCGADSESSSSFFITAGQFYASGNILSLCDFETTLSRYHFAYLFNKASGLRVDPDNLLTLPATTLANYCYSYMFYGCSSLTTAPALPATTLASYCYQNMFQGCSSLTTAPALPATTLAFYCYQNMFQDCSSLTTPPALPATTLADYCYLRMFQGCRTLTTAPSLPATKLASSCYQSMFDGCSSLTTPPALPATTLAGSCYARMFQGCSSLTTAPALSATTLANYCYSYMFYGCSSLTTPPALPATTLASYCYSNMFQGCSSLTTAPALPATTLVSRCYNNMFNKCSALSYVKAMFTNTPGYSYTGGWLSGVASTGTFVKNSAAQWNVSGVSGIPTGWTIETASE